MSENMGSARGFELQTVAFQPIQAYAPKLRFRGFFMPCFLARPSALRTASLKQHCLAYNYNRDKPREQPPTDEHGAA